MATTVVRRLYFYAAALLGLQLLAAGARDLVAALLEPLLGAAAVGAPQEATLRLSLNVALVVVGLPLWLVHWSVAQRGARAPDERRARLRRLYGYAVLAIAAIGVLSGLVELLGGLLDREGGRPTSAIASAIGALIVDGAIWAYHWRVFAADRAEAEQSGGSATLRRWYMAIVQGVSLGVASFAAADLIRLLVQLAVAPPAIGASLGLGGDVGQLIAGVAVWLPHHLWWRRLAREHSPLREDEARSSLRQVYAALVITVAAVAGLGGLTALLYQSLLAAFGQETWRAVLTEQTRAIAIALVAAPIWQYHRAQLAHEALLSQVPARTDTARRVNGYLMAAIGLGALFFGLGGLLATLLRMLLAPEALGVGWREPLSIYLALSVVALPVYGATARATERLARGSAAEERALARRIYLYVALLFGISATIAALVWLVRLLLQAMLAGGAASQPAEMGRWAGYAIIGAAIATYYALLVRRAGSAKGDVGAGAAIAVLAEEPLRQAILAAVAREAPGAALRALVPGDAALGPAEILIVALPELLDGPLAAAARGHAGPRLLLAAPAAGYTLVGARRGDALVRELAGALKTQLAETEPAASAPPAPRPVAAD